MSEARSLCCKDGFGREPASDVAAAIVEGIEAGVFEVTRGGEARARMIALNRENPAAIDERFLGLKSALEEAVKNLGALTVGLGQQGSTNWTSLECEHVA